MNIYGLDDSDYFGNSVSLSADGTVLAVGAPFRETRNPFNASYLAKGSVYVYKKISGAWAQIGSEIIVHNNHGSYYGSSVKLSSDGNVLAIGSQTSGSSDVCQR